MPAWMLRLPFAVFAPEGQEGPAPLDDSEAADAFLRLLGGDDSAKEGGDGPETTESPQEGGDYSPGSGTPGDEPEGSGEAPETGSGQEGGADDPEIELRIAGEEAPRKVKLSEVSKLYETRETTEKTAAEVSQARARAAAEFQTANAALQKMIQKAEERWKPYSELNYVLLAQKMDEGSFIQLQEDAKAAYQDVAFLKTELASTMQAEQARAQAAMRDMLAQSQASLAKEIPGWGPETAKAIRDYAVANGVAPQAADTIVDPVVVRIIQKAMQFDKGAKSASAKVKPTAPTSPRRAMSASAQPSPGKTAKQSALDELRRTGSEDAAERAFLSLLTD